MKLLLTLLLLPFLLAQAPAPPVDEAESRKIDEQIQRLWRKVSFSTEFDALSKKVHDLDESHEKQTGELYKKLTEFYNSEEYREFSDKSDELSEKRDEAWKRERTAMTAAARKIYSARHAELQARRARELPAAKALAFDVLNFPQLDGSTSTQPLNVILASRILEIPCEWLYPEPYGSNYPQHPVLPKHFLDFSITKPGSTRGYDESDYELVIAASRVIAQCPEGSPLGQRRIAVMINNLVAKNASTHDAYVSLIEGRSDLNINARGPSESERALARQKGVEIVLKPIALDALVFIVNKDNPIDTLTQQQLRDIYAGKTKLWTDVAKDPALYKDWNSTIHREPEKQIIPLWREKDSGSRELFDSLLMHGITIKEDYNRLYSNSMGGPFSVATDRKNALAYSVYYYEHFQALSPYTRTIAIDGVQPNPETIATKKYPLTAPVYAAYRANEKPSSNTLKLLNYLLSEEGQKLIQESGYVPVK